MSINRECSDEIVSAAKSDLLGILCELDDAERNSVEQWINSAQYRQDLQKLKSYRADERKLEKIADTLRKEMNLEAILPTENIIFPTTGSLGDCVENNTCHVDEFLYDEEKLEKLAKKGKFARHYCVTCGSRNTKELEMISHSLSRRTLLYIFNVLLPEDLSGKQVLDIGSRLGAVLYAADFFSNATKIVGVELNKELCDLQEKIITNLNLDIQVIHSDIMNEEAVIKQSNIIIINVFDFFVESPKQIDMWKFFKRTMKKGTLLITVRSVAETLTSLEIYEEFLDWLSITPPQQIENEILFSIEDDYSDIYFYTVN